MEVGGEPRALMRSNLVQIALRANKTGFYVGSGASLSALLECRTSFSETRLSNLQLITVVTELSLPLVGVWRKDSLKYLS
jgi:hypothetical protein